jgi:hypothetical protein
MHFDDHLPAFPLPGAQHDGLPGAIPRRTAPAMGIFRKIKLAPAELPGRERERGHSDDQQGHTLLPIHYSNIVQMREAATVICSFRTKTKKVVLGANK